MKSLSGVDFVRNRISFVLKRTSQILKIQLFFQANPEITRTPLLYKNTTESRTYWYNLFDAEHIYNVWSHLANVLWRLPHRSLRPSRL